jgi:hypothetical protein
LFSFPLRQIDRHDLVHFHTRDLHAHAAALRRVSRSAPRCEQSGVGRSSICMFSHIPPRPESNGNNPAAPAGAVHFSDMIYVFDNLRMKDYPWTDIDRKVADIMSSYWMNFVKTGNPNGAGLTDWPVYNPKDEFWLNIANPVRLERFNSAGVDVIMATNEDARKVP